MINTFGMVSQVSQVPMQISIAKSLLTRYTVYFAVSSREGAKLSTLPCTILLLDQFCLF